MGKRSLRAGEAMGRLTYGRNSRILINIKIMWEKLRGFVQPWKKFRKSGPEWAS